MTYFAKSKNKEGYQETVEHHLQRTAELCSEFGKDFDEEELYTNTDIFTVFCYFTKSGFSFIFYADIINT